MATFRIELVSIFPSTVQNITKPSEALPDPNSPSAAEVFSAVWAVLMGSTTLAAVDAAIDNAEFDAIDAEPNIKAGANARVGQIIQSHNWVIGLTQVVQEQFYQATQNGHEIVSKLVNTTLSGSPNIEYPVNVDGQPTPCYVYIHLRITEKAAVATTTPPVAMASPAVVTTPAVAAKREDMAPSQ